MSNLFSSPRPRNITPSVSPNVNAEPAPSPSASAEEMRRRGRASLLLATGDSGILGSPQTGRAALLST